MILTGFVLGKFTLGELFKDPISYIISAVRLMVMPLIFAGTLYLLGVRGLLFAIPVIISVRRI